VNILSANIKGVVERLRGKVRKIATRRGGSQTALKLAVATDQEPLIDAA